MIPKYKNSNIELKVVFPLEIENRFRSLYQNINQDKILLDQINIDQNFI